jgi:DNA-binding transcriptional regulator YiaG
MKMTIAELVEAAAAKVGNAKKLAELLGVTEETVSRWRNEKRVPQGMSLVALQMILEEEENDG